MYIRKRRKKWQCLVRHKGHRVAHSFASKSDARLWGQKVETELMNGSYQNNDKPTLIINKGKHYEQI